MWVNSHKMLNKAQNVSLRDTQKGEAAAGSLGASNSSLLYLQESHFLSITSLFQAATERALSRARVGRVGLYL